MTIAVRVILYLLMTHSSKEMVKRGNFYIVKGVFYQRAYKGPFKIVSLLLDPKPLLVWCRVAIHLHLSSLNVIYVK